MAPTFVIDLQAHQLSTTFRLPFSQIAFFWSWSVEAIFAFPIRKISLTRFPDFLTVCHTSHQRSSTDVVCKIQDDSATFRKPLQNDDFVLQRRYRQILQTFSKMNLCSQNQCRYSRHRATHRQQVGRNFKLNYLDKLPLPG